MGCDNVTLALGGAMKVDWGGDSHDYVGGELLCGGGGGSLRM
jgi:hypothetical protein